MKCGETSVGVQRCFTIGNSLHGVAQTKTWRMSAYSSRNMQSSLEGLACRMEDASEFMLRVLAMFVPQLLTNEHKQERVLDDVRDNRSSSRGSFAQSNGGKP